jgi:hypothetical protein
MLLYTENISYKLHRVKITHIENNCESPQRVNNYFVFTEHKSCIYTVLNKHIEQNYESPWSNTLHVQRME